MAAVTFRDYAGLAYAQNMRIMGTSKREMDMTDRQYAANMGKTFTVVCNSKGDISPFAARLVGHEMGLLVLAPIGRDGFYYAKPNHVIWP